LVYELLNVINLIQTSSPLIFGDITFCILCPKQFVLIISVTALGTQFKTGQIIVI